MRTLARILETENKPRSSGGLNDVQTATIIGVSIVVILFVLYVLQCIVTRLCGLSSVSCPDHLRNSCKRSSPYKRVLDSLPVAHYAPSSGSEACVICLTEYDEGDSVRVLPMGNHFLHVECIDQWLLRSFKCPVCRAPVIDHLKVDDHRVIRVSSVSSINVSRPII